MAAKAPRSRTTTINIPAAELLQALDIKNINEYWKDPAKYQKQLDALATKYR